MDIESRKELNRLRSRLLDKTLDWRNDWNCARNRDDALRMNYASGRIAAYNDAMEIIEEMLSRDCQLS